jgi:hypothetical protein
MLKTHLLRIQKMNLFFSLKPDQVDMGRLLPMKRSTDAILKDHVTH